MIYSNTAILCYLMIRDEKRYVKNGNGTSLWSSLVIESKEIEEFKIESPHLNKKRNSIYIFLITN